jgi:hypothetical protein
VHRVVRADEEVRADAGQLLGRRQHQRRDALPVITADRLHVVRQRVAVERDLRVRVLAEQRGGLAADGAVAERGALRGAGDDADVMGHLGTITAPAVAVDS